MYTYADFSATIPHTTRSTPSALLQISTCEPDAEKNGRVEAKSDFLMSFCLYLEELLEEERQIYARAAT
jgi:hypothetical protein